MLTQCFFSLYPQSMLASPLFTTIFLLLALVSPPENVIIVNIYFLTYRINCLILSQLKINACSLIFQFSVILISHATIISVSLIYLVLSSLLKVPSAAAG